MKPGFPVKSLNFGSRNAGLDSQKHHWWRVFFIFPDTYKNHTPKVLTSNLRNLKMIKMMDTPSSESLLQFFVSFCCWFQDVRLWEGTSGWWFIFGVGNLTRDVSNAMVNHAPWIILVKYMISFIHFIQYIYMIISYVFCFLHIIHYI